MKMKLLVVALVFLIIINLATLGTYLYFRFARDHDGPPFGPPNRAPEFMKQMDEVQRTRLFELMRGFHEETRDMRERVRVIEDETFRFLQRDPVIQDSVNARLEAISRMKLEISKRATTKLLAAREFLTAEQLEHMYRGILQMRTGPPGDGPPDGRPFPPGRMGRRPSPPDHRNND